MKAKTKEQKLIVSYRFLRLSNKRENWFKKKLFKPQYSIAWKWIYCHECGKRFRTEAGFDCILTHECPYCNSELEHVDKHTTRFIYYGSILTYRGQYQVERVYEIVKHLKRGEPAKYSFKEVVRNFIKENGNIIGMRVLHATSYFSYSFFGSLLELRGQLNDSNYIYTHITYPKKEILPRLRLYGFKGNDVGNDHTSTIRLLYTKEKAEILLKTNQYAILANLGYREDEVSENWRQIRIASRHKFIIDDPTIWFDYLNDLREDGKDINNPKYICDPNYAKVHQVYIERRSERLRKERKLTEQKTFKENGLVFFKHIAPFLGMAFSSEDIEIKPIPSLTQMYLEGKVLHHCIYSSSYYTKTDNLYLSAIVSGVRTETIELSLKEFRVVQARGLENENSPHHKDILRLMNKNIPKIKQLIKEMS